MRKVVLSVFGIIIIFLGVLIARYLIANKSKPEVQVQKVVNNVYVDTVQNKIIPVVIKSSGNLTAKRKIEIYSEVQGIFRSSSKLFREGETYSKGSVLLQIDASEFYASVQSQKSDLNNLLASIMPDIRMDYPDVYQKWQDYLGSFNMQNSVPDLPESSTEQEKSFITGRGIFTAYYNLKNLEQRLSKYTIRAPFDGILTEALVREGTLIRSGQQLGEFIDPEVYELEIAASKEYGPFLKIGKDVTVSNLEGLQTWEGKVSRINGKIDQATQTIGVFIDVKGENLKEGMYLEASLDARNEENAISIPRNLMMDNNHILAVNDTILELIEVKPVFYSDKNVILKGVPDGTTIISKAIPGAYPGMVVNVVKETTDNTVINENNKSASE